MFHSRNSRELPKMLCTWREQAAKRKAGEITKEEYDRWRYHYPEFDSTSGYVTVPSIDLRYLAKRFE